MRILNDEEIIGIVKRTKGGSAYNRVCQSAKAQYQQDLKDFIDENETDFIFLKELIANNETQRAVAFMIKKWESLKQLVE